MKNSKKSLHILLNRYADSWISPNIFKLFSPACFFYNLFLHHVCTNPVCLFFFILCVSSGLFPFCILLVSFLLVFGLWSIFFVYHTCKSTSEMLHNYLSCSIIFKLSFAPLACDFIYATIGCKSLWLCHWNCKVSVKLKCLMGRHYYWFKSP